MSYKCVHCTNVFKDGSKESLEGCSSCGSKFFFYVSEEKLKLIDAKKESEPKLSSAEKAQMEKDVRDIMGVKNEEIPVFLDFESIKIIKPGKYLLDIGKLFSTGTPRVYQLEDGKYIVDLKAAIKSKTKQ